MATTGLSLGRVAANGGYEADRAAALSAVPKTTVYWWASERRHRVPSVSPVRNKLWSHADPIFV